MDGWINMNLYVKKKNVFGNELIYPDCDTSSKFAAIAGTITLHPEVVALIKELGYTVQQKGETL